MSKLPDLASHQKLIKDTRKFVTDLYFEMNGMPTDIYKAEDARREIEVSTMKIVHNIERNR